MATTIITKNGSGAPLAGDLTAGELAVDLTNKRLYSKDSGGTVIELGTNAGSSTFEDLTVSGDLTVDTNTLYVDSTNNEVGINTTTPSRALDVRSGQQAISHFGSTSGVRGTITLSDANSTVESNQGIGAYGDDISIFTASAQRLTVDGSSGNVGIGTATATYDLTVVGASNLSTIGTNDAALRLRADGARAMQFYTNSAEAMRIDSSGNVGIGTSNPAYRLDAQVSDNTWAARVLNTRATEGNGLLVRSDSTDDPIALAVYGNGAYRMVVRADGNVGIGTTSPFSTARLQVNTGTNLNLAVQTGTTETSGVKINAFNDAATANIPLELNGSVTLLKTGETERMRIDSSGTVILKGPDDNALQFYESGSEIARVGPNSGNLNFLVGTTTTPRMTIDSSGNLLVGTTNASAEVGTGTKIIQTASPQVAQVSATTTNAGTAFSAYSTGAGAYRFFVGYGGNIYATSTSITAISDATLKENVRDLDKGLDTILALQPRRFDWKNGDGDDIMGFVAQEVKDVLPELVHDYKLNETETKLGLKMGDMIPSMVKAIQELSAQVNELKAEVAALKGA